MNLASVLAKIGGYFSRKFVLALGSLSAGFYLAINKIELTGFAGLVAVVLASYYGANVGEVITAYKASKLPKQGTDAE